MPNMFLYTLKKILVLHYDIGNTSLKISTKTKNINNNNNKQKNRMRERKRK